MEEHSFDEIAKEVASGALSRRRALKLFGGSLLGSAFLSFHPGVAEARKKKKKKKKCFPIGGGGGGGGQSFNLVRSQGAVNAGNSCIPNATGTFTINPVGPVEVLTVKVSGLPANKSFDLFVIQVPDAPFGVSWYQGDLETDANGNGSQTYVGRFSSETFAVAPGTDSAPNVHPGVDATSNPPFNPIHTFHLGLWFNSPADAQAAGCPNTQTPFNGDHTAGIQALSTRTFAKNQGPLRQITSTA